jgi:hypothetical protein
MAIKKFAIKKKPQNYLLKRPPTPQKFHAKSQKIKPAGNKSGALE